MKRAPWLPKLNVEGEPEINVLIAETDYERIELMQRMQDAGVCNRVTFRDDGRSVRLEMSEDCEWTESGAAIFNLIDSHGTEYPAYFWVLEMLTEPPRFLAYWSEHDSPKEGFAFS